MTSESKQGSASSREPINSGSMLIALASFRNTEAQLRWQGAQWVTALNLSAFVALMYQMLSTPKTPEFFVLAIGCGAIGALDFEWYNVLRRDGKLLNFWNTKLREHEDANGTRGGVQVFTCQEYESLANARTRLQRMLERLTVWFIFGWSITAIVLFTWAIATWKGGAL